MKTLTAWASAGAIAGAGIVAGGALVLSSIYDLASWATRASPMSRARLDHALAGHTTAPLMEVDVPGTCRCGHEPSLGDTHIDHLRRVLDTAKKENSSE